jgi:hypothetical protein
MLLKLAAGVALAGGLVDAFVENVETVSLEDFAETPEQHSSADPTEESLLSMFPENTDVPANNKIHILFSTGCNAFQHWQGEVRIRGLSESRGSNMASP